MNPGNIQHPTSNAQHPWIAQIAGIGCSKLDVGCWMFSSFGSWVQSANAGIGRNLSPKERVPCRPSLEMPARLDWSQCGALPLHKPRFARELPIILPLPFRRGEGRGEGSALGFNSPASLESPSARGAGSRTHRRSSARWPRRWLRLFPCRGRPAGNASRARRAGRAQPRRR